MLDEKSRKAVPMYLVLPHRALQHRRRTDSGSHTTVRSEDKRGPITPTAVGSGWQGKNAVGTADLGWQRLATVGTVGGADRGWQGKTAVGAVGTVGASGPTPFGWRGWQRRHTVGTTPCCRPPRAAVLPHKNSHHAPHRTAGQTKSSFPAAGKCFSSSSTFIISRCSRSVAESCGYCPKKLAYRAT